MSGDNNNMSMNVLQLNKTSPVQPIDPKEPDVSAKAMEVKGIGAQPPVQAAAAERLKCRLDRFRTLTLARGGQLEPQLRAIEELNVAKTENFVFSGHLDNGKNEETRKCAEKQTQDLAKQGQSESDQFGATKVTCRGAPEVCSEDKANLPAVKAKEPATFGLLESHNSQQPETGVTPLAVPTSSTPDQLQTLANASGNILEAHVGAKIGLAVQNTGKLTETNSPNSHTNRLTEYPPTIPNQKLSKKRKRKKMSGRNAGDAEDWQSSDEESEYDSSDEPEPTAKPLSGLTQESLVKEKFVSWVESNEMKQLSEEDRLQELLERPVEDERATTSYLMAQQESELLINKPREYQLELFERAKFENTIAVLDTGSGKTLIAVMLLKHTIDKELERRSSGELPRISFFLVDCVTLAFQQFAVIERNIDQKADRFCGSSGVDLWSKETWDTHFSQNMVIVCTAEVLYHCLMHSFISIEQINLLIFDEAHHAKKNHPYARIIREFYLEAKDSRKRPRIFGMTASPVDARVNVLEAAQELETLLHARIATTTDLGLLQRSVHKPEELNEYYDPLPYPFETALWWELRKSFGHLKYLTKTFQFAKHASSELGSWCSDQVWSYALDEEEAMKLERTLERKFMERGDGDPELLNTDLRQLGQIRDIVMAHPFREPKVDLNDLSSKVLKLHECLQDRFEAPTEQKCIVFVQQRYTAKLLADLFSRIGASKLKTGTLVGAGNGDLGDLNLSFRKQVLTLTRFRKGELNCLFATSIAEEGLDVPDCNLVVRFDPYRTTIQYMQSRGRARQAGSKYIHLIENGNLAHLRTIQDCRFGEVAVKNLCNSLPEDRLLRGNDYGLEEAGFWDKGNQSYLIPSTGARLTYGSCLAVLSHFVGSLGHKSEGNLSIDYVVRRNGNEFICEVVLPEQSPIRSAVGRPEPRKITARRAAAFQACVLLRRQKYLDENLVPTYQKTKRMLRNVNASLALKSKAKSEYARRVKSDFWKINAGTIPEELFLTVIYIPNVANLSPIGILTRSRFPDIPWFDLYLKEKETSIVQIHSLYYSLAVTEELLNDITTFTALFFDQLFRKVYEEDVTLRGYWIVPIYEHLQGLGDGKPFPLIDWSTLSSCIKKPTLEWDVNTPDALFEGKFITDPYNGGSRYITKGVRHDLRPRDQTPAGGISNVLRKKLNSGGRSAEEKAQMTQIIEQCNSVFKRSAKRSTFMSDDQPVIQAVRVNITRNWLDVPSKKDRDFVTDAYICPASLKISSFPVTFAAMGFQLPCIMWRIESCLIALDGFRSLNLDVKPEFALEALTRDSCNMGEHRGSQLDYQRGMAKNYERLEFLGDAFLKMATSIAIFAKFPADAPFDIHCHRMVMICNKNLFKNAVKTGIFEYIRSSEFVRREWYPEDLKLLHGKGAGQTPGTDTAVKRSQSLADKTIADVCEAMIGAAYLSRPTLYNFDNAVKAVTAMVGNDTHTVQRWGDYQKKYEMIACLLVKPSASQLDLLMQIARKDNYVFRNARLLRSAFLHRSYAYIYESIPSYERLESLGDALWDMVCVDWLFKTYPNRDPQWLTEHKMAMVANKFQAALCVRLGFNKHIRFTGDLLRVQISNYVDELVEAEDRAKGSPDYWNDVRSPPKALADVLEAYVGALFVDSKFDYRQVERFFNDHVLPYFTNMDLYDSFAEDHPTTRLSNLLLKSFGCINYRVWAHEIACEDPTTNYNMAGVWVHDQVIGEGRAPSSKSAKIGASKDALDKVRALTRDEFREKYGCDCKEEDTKAVLAGEKEVPLGTAI